MLACTVRGCGEALFHKGRAFICEKGHLYDIARSGYVNLLQPQDRRSLDAGDSKDIVAARSRLFAAGLGSAVVDALAERVASLALPSDACVVDLGCGTGDALARITSGAPAIGIDIAVAAVDHASRAFPALTWVVANADRRLPLLDGGVSVIVSLHARRNPDECARVLVPGGRLMVAVPAADDLLELRTAVQGMPVERDRVEALIAAHAPLFDVAGQASVSERRHVAGGVLQDLLRVTYRGARHSEAGAASALTGMDVTLASEIVVFTKRGEPIDSRPSRG